jgi:polyisoprenoid-binding protein YceI
MKWFLGLMLAFSAVPAFADGAAGNVLVYKVVPESDAFYAVQAMHLFFPETVHGLHGAVSGEIRLARGVSPTVGGELDISVGTLKSGNTSRDAQVLSTLDAKAHPDISFTITGVEPFSVAALDAAGVTVTAHGSLDVAGVSVPLSFPVFARREGGKRLRLSGTAHTGFKDLKLKAPGVAVILPVLDPISAGADIVADQIP